MKICFVSSEVFPYSKTGGLADIAYFLPKGLTKLGHAVTVVTPYYQSIGKYHQEMTFLGRNSVVMGGIETIVNYFQLKRDDIKIIFVQNMHYFEREKYYGYNDDAERFTCFSYAVLELLKFMPEFPDLLHINDWQTGMIPFLLDTHYRNQLQYQNLQVLLTIHNLEYQGNFDTYVSRFFNTDFNYTYIHFDRVNFLKAGIERASVINTVSPHYREEILTRAYGFGLDGSLQNRKDALYGILNGIDYETFNPKTDQFIFQYDDKNYQNGKVMNKKQLYDMHHLNPTYEKPLIAYIGRFARQKGLWMIKESLESVLQNSDAIVFFLGSGEDEYANYFRYITEKYPGRAGNYIGYNESLAHLVYAASDIFLMPSEFEPCGLGQMISMKYGTLPIVRQTGGLFDTVKPYNKFSKEGTGFGFYNLSSFEFKDKVFEAINLYNHEPKTWDLLVRQAMKQDYSNESMSKSYEQLYKKMVGEN